MTTQAVEHYRDAFLPVYETVCGDTKTYSEVADDFQSFLTFRAADSVVEGDLGRSRSYLNVAGGTAFDKDARHVFEEFLDNGRRCDDLTPAGMAVSAGAELKDMAQPDTPYIANNMVLRSNPAKLYVEWHRALVTYVNMVRDIIPAIAGPRGSLWETANRAEAYARTLGITMKELLKAPPQTLEWLIIRSQWSRINNFRTSANMIKDAANPDSWASDKFEEILGDAPSIIGMLFEPLDWIEKVVRRYPAEGTKKVTISVSNPASRITINKIETFWELMDWLFIISDRVGSFGRPVNIDVAVSDDHRLLTITMPQVQSHLWPYLDILTYKLSGRRVLKLGTEKNNHLILFMIPVSDPLAPEDPNSSKEGTGHDITGLLDSGEAPPSMSPRFAPASSPTGMARLFSCNPVPVWRLPAAPATAHMLFR